MRCESARPTNVQIRTTHRTEARRRAALGPRQVSPPMAARLWSDAEDQIIRDGYANGVPVRQLARTLGCGITTISTRAKALGATTHARSRTERAVTAKVLDAKARKTTAMMAELEILELSQRRTLAAMRKTERWSTILRGDMGVENVVDVVNIPARDLRDEASARSSMMSTIAKLDTDDGGATEARSMLENLAAALGVKGPDQ